MKKPRPSAGTSRTHNFRLLFSNAEARELAELANEKGVSMAGWLRMIVRSEHERMRQRREVVHVVDVRAGGRR